MTTDLPTEPDDTNDTNNQNDEVNQNDQDQLIISDLSQFHLMQVAKWSKFLSIIGFIFVGIFVIISFVPSVFFSNNYSDMDGFQGVNPMEAFPMGLFTLIYLLMAALYFFPVLYLFKFSTKMKRALYQKDGYELEQSFENLKSHYKFIGILTIIILVIYAVLGISSAILFSAFM